MKPGDLVGSSPHTRGARYREIGFETIDRIIPAYAGSTLPLTVARGAAQDHPRIRGEHFREVGTLIFDEGSSPHTRGALGRFFADEDAVGIIPAYAGSTSARWERLSSTRDHPRIRGEH